MNAAPAGPPRRRQVALPWILAAAAAAALVFIAWPRDAGRSRSPPAAGGDGDALPGGVPRLASAPGRGARAAASASPRTDRLPGLDALASADPATVRSGAIALRHAARTDPGSFAALVAALLDPATAPALRPRLALVLGTIEAPGVDAALRDAVARYEGEPGLLAAVLLALGAQRTPPDDDEVFDLGDRPHGAQGPGGLGVTVRRRIEDAETRAFLADRLGAADPSVRYAAARAMSESSAYPEARAALRAALESEPRDDVAARLAEPLGAWAATAPAGLERDGIAAALLERALSPGADETRLRLEKDLARAPIPAASFDRLLEAAGAGGAPEVRGFALTVLPAAAARAGEEPVRRARGRLEDLLSREADPATRDLAARGLGALPSDGGTLAVLARASREDREWRVRFAAVSALGRHAREDAARGALDAATKDADPRVAAEAKRALATGSSR